MLNNLVIITNCYRTVIYIITVVYRTVSIEKGSWLSESLCIGISVIVNVSVQLTVKVSVKEINSSMTIIECVL